MSNSSIIDEISQQFQIRDYKRIVSLVPSITDLLLQFGLNDRLIGVTQYCEIPDSFINPKRVIIGGTKNPNIEKIIELKPDIIIANKEENQEKHVRKLIEFGLNSFVTYPTTVDEAIVLFKKLYRLFNLDDKEIYEQITNLEFFFNSLNTTKKKNFNVFCPIWKEPWMVFNKNTFANSMLENIGNNIFSDSSERYPKVTMEEIISKNPNLILLPDEPYNFKDQDILELKNIPEFKEVPIFLISGKFHWYSIRMSKEISNLLKIIRSK